MPIIKVRDNENNRWNRNGKKITKNKADRKEQRGNASCSERVRANWFCCTFQLGFLQLNM